jgi:hypothetical protein
VSENLKELAAKLSSIARKKNLKGRDIDVLKEVREGLARVMMQVKECDLCGGVVPDLVKMEMEGIKASVCQECGIKLLKNPKLVRRKGSSKNASEKKIREKKPAATRTRAPKPAKTARAKKSGSANTRSAKAGRTRKKSTKTNIKIGSFAARAQKELEKTEARKKTPQMAISFEEGAEPDSNGRINFEGIAKKQKVTIGAVRKIFKIENSIAFPMSPEGTLQFVKSELAGEAMKIGDSELKGILAEIRKEKGVKVK